MFPSVDFQGQTYLIDRRSRTVRWRDDPQHVIPFATFITLMTDSTAHDLPHATRLDACRAMLAFYDLTETAPDYDLVADVKAEIASLARDVEVLSTTKAAQKVRRRSR